VPVFIRGDANADGRINISDAVRVLSHLFLNDPAEPGCPDALDAGDDGEVNLADALAILFYVIGEFAGLIGFCAPDPTEDELGCLDFSPCGTPPVKRNSLGMELVFIHPGTFLMGSPPTERGRAPSDSPVFFSETQHQVTLTYGFYMSKTKVTQADYVFVMGDLPYVGPDVCWSDQRGPDLPVVCATYFQARLFCSRLSKLEGVEYRLPTEAEWEYACRAGTTTRFWFGDALACPDDRWECSGGCNIGPFMWCTGEMINPVGQKKPNPWGLYDMHDNAFEWCLDWAAPYPADPVTDPRGPASGNRRIVRSSGASVLAHARSASRASSQPWGGGVNLSFRVVQPGVQVYHITP
jgi:formylglycine-generating enzyme required for sulfatase activity